MRKLVREWGLLLIQIMTVAYLLMTDNITEKAFLMVIIITLQIISEIWDLKDNYLN